MSDSSAKANPQQQQKDQEQHSKQRNEYTKLGELIILDSVCSKECIGFNIMCVFFVPMKPL